MNEIKWEQNTTSLFSLRSRRYKFWIYLHGCRLEKETRRRSLTLAKEFENNDDWYVKKSSGNASGNWIFHIQIQVCLGRREMRNIWCIMPRLKPRFNLFCFFHRHNNFLCYISDFFLPRRERKFGDNVTNCMEQYNHFYMFVIYLNHVYRPRTVWCIRLIYSERVFIVRSTFCHAKMKSWIKFLVC